MPGIDYAQLRREIPMQQVLALLGFDPSRCRGDQWHGACPLAACSSHLGPCFSVNVSSGRYFCHRCRSHGNQLELWSAATRMPLYPAAIDLCRALGRPIPWIHRW